jgi:hypothetical protein
MFETLYKTNAPEPVTSEYYQLHLDSVLDGKTWAYFVREKHGWHIDAEKRAVDHRETLGPEEGFSTLEEAEARYTQQLKYRADQGFVHSFTPVGPDSENGHHTYRLIDLR